MTKFFNFLGALTPISACQFDNKMSVENNTNELVNIDLVKPIVRSVNNNALTSDSIPKIEIKVDEEFKYIGKFDFEIIASSDEYPPDMIGEPVAAGERLVFASADEELHVDKLFIVQFEEFLNTNEFIYNYNFDATDLIGKNKYRHNTWHYDGQVSIKENPLGEWAKTDSFLKENNLIMDDHIMMSRFVGLASGDRKNEIIIFYHEFLKNSTGHTLNEWENSVSTEEKLSTDSAFVQRSTSSFKIIND